MIASPSHLAYIALGANLGDRERNIRDAIDCLRRDPRINVVKVSSLIENPAVGGPPDSPAFLNGVAEIQTTLEPWQLLQTLLAVERQLGRERHLQWEARTIDLDLLLFGNRIMRESDLIVPHPRMHQRRFVLQPLAEIAPELRHPESGMTVARMLAELDVYE